jgi:hypothetical protein
MRRSGLFSKRFILIGLVVAVFGALSVAAIAATSGGDSVRLADPSEPAVQSVDASAASGFGFLRAAQTAADRLPAAVAAVAHLPYGANVELSRRVAWSDGAEVYAIPGRDFICTVVPNADGATAGCQPTDAILTGKGTGPALIHSAKTDAVYAVVPDGVSGVTLGLASGKTIDVPVQNGGYYAEVPTSDAPRTISYDGPNGAVTQQVPVPPDLPLG